MADNTGQTLAVESKPTSKAQYDTVTGRAPSLPSPVVVCPPGTADAVVTAPRGLGRKVGDCVKYLIIGLRPKQWVKNFFVIAPLFFSGRLLEGLIVARCLSAFGVFCLLSSSIYLLNDIFDLEKDRNHPRKSRRPLASGMLSVRTALISSIVLLCVAACSSSYVDARLLLVGLAYWATNLFYTLALKHVVIVDVICIAVGFVLRVTAGAVAVDVPPSPWILTSTIFVALFLGCGKRKGEIVHSSAQSHRRSRPVLENYSTALLDQMLVICAAASIMSYALFSLSDYAFARFGTHNLIYTTPFVIFGVFRYLYIIEFTNFYENPTETLFADKALAAGIVMWLACVVAILYWR